MLATRKIKRMGAFAILNETTWYTDLAFVGKVAKDKNGVKKSTSFSRTV